jgi:hypothetical protein
VGAPWGRPSSSDRMSNLRTATDDDAPYDPLSAAPEAVDRLAEVTAALIALGESPEVARIAAEELEKVWLGVPMDEERFEAALDASLSGRPEDDAEFVAKGRALAEGMKNLKLGDLIPSDEQLNADPELEAWFAGIPGAPLPRRIRAASSPAPKVAGIVASRVQVRPRERRVRAGGSRARSPGRPSADDDDDPVGRRRRKAVAA